MATTQETLDALKRFQKERNDGKFQKIPSVFEKTDGEWKEIPSFIDETDVLLFDPRAIARIDWMKLRLDYEKQCKVRELLDSSRKRITNEICQILSHSSSKDVAFNFPLIDSSDGIIIPSDLHLVFSEKDTVSHALNRLYGQYRKKFNAVIIRNSSGWVRGFIRSDLLEKSEGSELLWNLQIETLPMITLETPQGEAEDCMMKLGINILPVVDKKSEALVGIIAKETIIKKETRFYTTQLSTNIRLKALHTETTSHS